jgi:Glycosyltransferase family 87
MSHPLTFTLSPAGRRSVRRVAVLAAVVGVALGLETLLLHLTSDPLNDVQAYYWAGGRLNAGLPLYPPDQSVATPLGYPYPPLLAILFRPLALLPFEAAAAIWEVAVIASFVLTVWWIGPRRRETWLALGILALPIAWCLVIGQAQVLLTLFTAIGAPWSIALAANIKLFPAAIALWWIGRRDWRSLGLFVATIAGLALLQLVLAPQASLDYFTAISLKQVGAIRNISPYAISPLLWGALIIGGVAVVLRLAPTRWGWPAAVVLSVVGTPRLLVYMFMTFIAALSEPRGHRRR